jgi:glycine hydroxymethyltransferase
MTKLNKYSSNSFQNFFDNDLSVSDPDLYNSVKLELERQQQHVELIASENIVSKAVLDAQGSIIPI